MATSDETSAATPISAPSASEDGRSPMLEIANAVVRLYKEAFGRGPTKARAQFAGPDVLVVLLENSLTGAERNLVAMDEHARVRETRALVQGVLEAKLRAIVERALGRRTVAFVSGIDTHRDLAIELVTLEPEQALDSNDQPIARRYCGYG